MKKIILIDNNHTFAARVGDFLGSRGFNVGVISDGSKGVQELKMNNPDMVILGSDLGAMSLYDFLDIRSKDVDLKAIPLLLATENVQHIDPTKITEYEVTDSLVKIQISNEDIHSKVVSILGLGSSNEDKIVDLDIDKETAIENNFKNNTILWIEDDMFLSSIVGKKLMSSGAKHIQAKSGDEAFAALESEIPDAIVLDLILPGMDGFQILERLKADPKTKDIPVIVLSNLDQRNDMEKCFKLGASKFFVKALVTLDKILEEVATLVKK